MPQQPWKREFAIQKRTGKFIRHVAIISLPKLVDFIRRNNAAHCFLSTAVYERPGKRMSAKGWRWSNLVFDFDGDHIAPDLPYLKQVQAAKHEMLRLLTVLDNDLGIGPEDRTVAFSGNRGYHVWTHNIRVNRLGSTPRRELVDFLTAQGLRFSHVISYHRFRDQDPIPIMEYKEHSIYQQYRSAVENFLSNMTRRQFVDTINLDRTTAVDLYDHMPKIWTNDRVFLPLSQFLALAELINDNVSAGIVLDEPVTADTARLMRLPGSLHGKTGFKVTILPEERIAEFSPTDAIVLSGDLTRLKIMEPVEVYYPDGSVGKHVAGLERLPRYAAYVAVMKGAAEVLY